MNGPGFTSRKRKRRPPWAVMLLPLLLIPLLLLLSSVPAEAAQLDGELEENLHQQLLGSGAQELADELPPEAKELLEQMELGEIDVGRLLSLSPGDFVRVLWQRVKDQASQPLATFGAIAGVSVLCALVGTLRDTARFKALSSVFSTVSLLCIITVIVRPVTDCILGTAQTLRDFSTFLLSFIPVFTSIITVSGAPVTATTYNILLFGACQLISMLATRVLVPFMGIYTGLCVAGSVGEDIGVLPIAKGVRSFVTWGLSLAMTAYVGLLSMQTLVSAGADGAMLKAGKFLVGSFVPIVGGAISDALSAAQGALHLLKTTVGAFGIVAGAVLFLPSLIRVLLWYLMLKAASYLAGTMSLRPLSSLLEACSNCLSTMLALLVSFLLLIIVSILLLLSFSSAGASA